jgi:ABC-type polar amino acid transport system ATPase subunit
MNRAPAPPASPLRASWWVLDPRVSLRARAALLAAAAGAALTALGATLAAGALERELTARTGAQLEAAAQQLADRLDQTVAEHLRVLRTGAALRVVRAPAAPAEKRQALLDLLDPQPELAWLALADVQGRITAATALFPEGADVALQPWFRGAREQAFASDPRESPALPPRANREESLDGPPRALELAVPVADADGNPAGVLAAGLRWDWTRDALRAALPEPLRRARIGATVYAEAGTVLLDGRDLRDVELASYRKLLGIVEQDVFLFDGTVADNIRYADPSASDERVRWAARAAHADAFIEAMPQGYATAIGERGVRLSGGQRQRIAIARALLADPRILILDEATSNLDTESERAIQEALATLMQGRTSFVIAHRLSTIMHADRIVVLEDGRVAEVGTHAELMERSGPYRQMVLVQTAPPPERAPRSAPSTPVGR